MVDNGNTKLEEELHKEDKIINDCPYLLFEWLAIT